MAKFDPKAWINLEKAKVLLLDDHAEGGNILAQIVMGFGVRRFMRCGSVAEAREVCNHTERGAVERARDCGSNIVLAKPVSPQSLLERIIWIAREKRPFVNCGSYMGPDRRFHDTGPPAGVQGRRAV